jgi:ribosomal RNA-processing protein 9
MSSRAGSKRPRPSKSTRRDSFSEESDAGGGVDDLDLTDKRDEDNRDLENPAQKRLRLARSYLTQVTSDIAAKKNPVEVAEGVYEFSAEDVDRELIADRLVQDQLEATGKAFHRVAEKLVKTKQGSFELNIGDGELRTFGGRDGHRLACTGLAFASPKAASSTVRPPVYLYSVSKDASVIKWDFYTAKEVSRIIGQLKRTKKRKQREKASGKKKKEPQAGEEKPQGHTDEIWSIACSSDGKYLVGFKSSVLRLV